MDGSPEPNRAHPHPQGRLRDNHPAQDSPPLPPTAPSDAQARYDPHHVHHDPRAPRPEQVRYPPHRLHASLADRAPSQLNINVSLAESTLDQQNSESASRPTSVSSSLDPYYFGIGSPSDSPTHPLPSASSTHLSITPDRTFASEPTTPARNPASIDRRGLVGVGELATPRWSKNDSSYYEVSAEEVEHYQIPVREDEDEEQDDAPDSPWTIEAIDGEASDREDEVHIHPSFFSLVHHHF